MLQSIKKVNYKLSFFNRIRDIQDFPKIKSQDKTTVHILDDDDYYLHDSQPFSKETSVRQKKKSKVSKREIKPV